MDRLNPINTKELKEIIRHWHLMRWSHNPEIKEAALDFIEFLKRWKNTHLFEVIRGRGEE